MLWGSLILVLFLAFNLEIASHPLRSVLVLLGFRLLVLARTSSSDGSVIRTIDVATTTMGTWLSAVTPNQTEPEQNKK